jgi:choice-of-anchor B domain-containing protein
MRMTAAALSAALALSVFAVPAWSQANNTVLLANLDPYTSLNYNDVWGYVAPNGDEYALVGTTGGMAVVDTTIPTQPVVRGFFNGPTSTWRDIRTYGNYAYVVTEGGGGMQIIDLSNPNAPALVQTWGAQLWGNAHNICIDTATGMIVVIGTNNGSVVIDASQNPANPTFVGYHLTGAQSDYYHDMHIQNGLAHGSMIYRGVYRLLDVTTWPFTVLSERATPNTFTHNAWPNANDSVAVTTDERAGAVVKFWNISNPSSPVGLGSFTPNTNSIPHNAFIVGNVCHVAWYTEGYRAIDITNPNQPVEIGSYDTWPGASGGFNGAWGCYPFQPSGNIYVNDISTGLYIVRLQNLNIAHQPLVDTTNEAGPYAVACDVSSSEPIQSVELVWRVGGGSETRVAMSPGSPAGRYDAAIPGQLAPARVEYAIEVQSGGATKRSPGPNAWHAFQVGVLTRVFFDDFEAGAGGWTHGFVLRQDDWQLGAPFGRGGTVNGVAFADPASAYSGTNCWGNDLGGSGFNGIYQPSVSNWLQSPAIPTNGVQGLRLRFRRWLTIESGAFDQAQVLVNNQIVWSNPTNANLIDTAWNLLDLDISSIANGASSLNVRFTLITDGGANFGGWTIDDFEIYRFSDCFPPELYGAGTAGTGGIEPTISGAGEPRIGTTFTLQGGAMLGGSTAVLGIAPAATSLPIAGITLLVDPLSGYFFTQPVSGSPGVAGAGSSSLSIPIPADPQLDNADIFHQWLVLDPGSPGALLASSRGLRARICQF